MVCGQKSLNVALSVAMALSLVPTRAVPALAEELEAQAEVVEQEVVAPEEQGAETVEQETQTEAGEEAPASEAEPESEPEAAPDATPTPEEEQSEPEQQAAPQQRSAKKAPALKAPSASDFDIEVSYLSDEPAIDSTYKDAVTVGIKITPKTSAILSSTKPKAAVTYHNQAGDLQMNLNIPEEDIEWLNSSSPAVCTVTLRDPGSYGDEITSYMGLTLYVKEGGSDVETSLTIRFDTPFAIATTPWVSAIHLKDEDDEYIKDPEDDTKDLDLRNASGTIVEEARALEVDMVAYALDYTDDVDTTKSKAMLVDKEGTVVAEATFAPKKDDDGNPVAHTFTAVIDHPGTDKTKPLDDGFYGVQVVAVDKFGNQLKRADDEPYVLYHAKVEEDDEHNKTVKADGTFAIDACSPDVSIIGYPHSTAIAPSAGAPSGIDLFDRSVSFTVQISDISLSLANSTIAGVTLSQMSAEGESVSSDGLTIKFAKDETDPGSGVRTVTYELAYGDGTYDASTLVSAADTNSTHEATKRSLKDDYGIDAFAVDASAPVVTDATIGAEPMEKAIDGDDRVYFFKTDNNAPLTLYVQEPHGIKSVALSGADGYTLSSSVDGVLAAKNPHIAEASFDGVYELQVIDTLMDGAELPDDMTVTITDLVGNVRTWSFTGEGTEQLHAHGMLAVVENADTLYDALGGTALLHPTILVEDDTKPVLTLTGPEDRTDAVVPGYERVYPEAQDVSLKVVEFNMRYLRNFTAGSEGDTNVNGDFPGIDPSREVMTIDWTDPDGNLTQRKVTAADLDFSANGVYTWKSTIADDGDYEIRAKVVDAAGNESDEKTIAAFTIDTTAPVITAEWVPADTEAINGGYFNSTRKGELTVEEANFDPNLFELKVVANNTPSDYTPFVYDPTAWTDNGDGTYTYTLDLDTDGRYSLALRGKDMAGNLAEYEGDDLGYASGEFVIDTEAPIIAKYVNSDESHDPADLVVVMPEPMGTYDGVNYYNASLDLYARIKDRNFNTEDTKFDGAKVSWVSGERDDDGYILYETTKSFSSDGEYKTPHIEAVDMAENTSDNSADIRSFIIDLEAPTIKVSANRDPVTQGTTGGSSDPYNFYNGGTTLTLTVSDKHALKDVKLQDPDGYTANWDKNPLGEKQVTGTVTLREYSSSADEFDRAIILSATDIAGNRRTWSIDHTGTVTQVEGPSAANASINDKGEHPVLLVKDTTPPVVGLSGVTAGTFYNTPQSVAATVNERVFNYLKMFDGGRAIVTVTKYEGNASRAMSTWTIPASSFTGSSPNYSFSQPFDSDGHYTLRAQFRDYAENLSNEATIGEFTIDMTPPQLSMEFDNNDVRNEKYYKATRTATITVVEHNFDPSLFTIDTSGAIGGWVDNGDTHTCTVFFDEGGPYTITVNGKDMAGNEATEVTEPEFIVDLTAPEIEIAGTAQRLGYVGDEGSLVNAYHDTLEDKNAYNGVVVPVITYKDNEVLSSADLSHTLDGSKHGEEVEHESTMSEEDKEMTVTLRDMGYAGEGEGDGSNWEDFYVDDYDVDADDIYTIKAAMTDQAGNEAEAELTFSVNRYGSNYEVTMQGMADEELEEYGRSGMLSEAPTIVVREVNVSGVADQDKDGNIVPDNHHVEKEFANATTAINLAGGEGSGYDLNIVEPKRAENGWSEYIYTVRSANFGEGSDSDHNDRGQGVYRVNVMSDDTSSNANTTADYWRSDAKRTQVKADGATAEFILDELGPTIDDLDLPEGISRGESYEASFHVTDDITSGNTVEVEVDGRRLDSSQVHGAANGTGTFTFDIPARAFNWHRSVKITVTDYAGRTVSERNHGWAWQSTFIPEGAVVVGAVAVVVAGVAALRKRREAAEPELPE